MMQNKSNTIEYNSSYPIFSIGNIAIDPPLALAPMAGITDLPFRILCKPMGVGLCVTEMIASRAVAHNPDSSERMVMLDDGERPVAVQIAGADPMYMQQAARWAVQHGADFVDINMGCPVKKVCKQQAGSALLRDELLIARILEAVVAAVAVPVTLKIRTGWDENSKNVAQVARVAEDCGVQMLTVHGRTRAALFSGHAKWEDIGLAKAAVRIPVIGNGDVCDAASAAEMLRISGCDGVMIGRAVQGNPWVLAEVAALLRSEPAPEAINAISRWEFIKKHLHLLAEHYGQHRASLLARKHVFWYSHNLQQAADFRRRFQCLTDWQEQLSIAEQWFLQALPAGKNHV
ncbi:MAG: tRNA dihydrouridine synthase DusB [Mariprofundales bacterium]